MKDLANHAPLRLDLFTFNNTITNSANQRCLPKKKKNIHVTSIAVHFFLLCDLQYHIPFKPFKRWVSFITLFKNPWSALEYSQERIKEEALLFIFFINLYMCVLPVSILEFKVVIIVLRIIFTSSHTVYFKRCIGGRQILTGKPKYQHLNNWL